MKAILLEVALGLPIEELTKRDDLSPNEIVDIDGGDNDELCGTRPTED